MYQYDDPTCVATLPTPAASGTPGYFTNGSPGTGQAATILSADYMNAVMLELLNVVKAAGLSPSKTAYNQVVTAVKALTQQGAANVGIDTGMANACVVAFSPALTAPMPWAPFWFEVANTNTGASTLNATGTAYPLVGAAHAPLQGGELVAKGNALVYWNPTLNSGAGAYVLIECSGGASQLTFGSYVATPAQFDNSMKLATTAYAMSLGLRGPTLILTAGGTLAPATVGSFVALTALPSVMSYQTVLPLLSSVPAGSMYEFVNISPYAMTLSRQGSDSLTVSGPGMTTFVVNPGDSVFVASLNGFWVISGSGALSGSSSFGALLGASGYQKLPSGLIIQWGNFTINFQSAPQTTAMNVSYPIVFPNGAYTVTATALSSTPTIFQAPSVVLASPSQFTAYAYAASNNATQSYYYIAIGR